MFLKKNNKKNNQLGNSKKINEEFEVGKANMEYPDYEIKITGQVPIDYAKAIDDRQKRVEKIEDDFKEKDKIEDEFEKETAQHKEINETLNMQNKYLKESVYDELVQDLKENGFEVYNIDEVDEETKEDMKASKAKIAIYFPEAARTWFFTDEDSMVIYFKNGGKLDVNKTGLVEAIPNKEFSIEDTYVISGTEYGKKKAVIVAYRKTTNDFSVREVNSNYVFDDARLRFLTKEDAEKFIEVFKPYSSCDTLKVSPARNPVSVTKINTSYSDVVDCYVSETYIVRNVDNETLTEAEVAEEPKKRVRSKNRNAEDKMYSSDDKWLQVYDDLSSEVDNEGPKGEVNKQVKIPRGKRFSGPYAGPGDYDLTVYATNRDDLKWAEKIADHYGVDIDIKEDKSKNVYYPWYAILRDIR